MFGLFVYAWLFFLVFLTCPSSFDACFFWTLAFLFTHKFLPCFYISLEVLHTKLNMGFQMRLLDLDNRVILWCVLRAMFLFTQRVKKKGTKWVYFILSWYNRLGIAAFYQDQQEYPSYFVDFTLSGFLRLDVRRQKAGILHSKRLFSRIPVAYKFSQFWLFYNSFWTHLNNFLQFFEILCPNTMFYGIFWVLWDFLGVFLFPW